MQASLHGINTSSSGSSITGAAAYSYPPTPQDWARIKDAVRDLYVVEKKHLREVRSVLRDQHGFRATERMIKARLKHWEYMKNAKKKDWHHLARLHYTRKQEGRVVFAFDVRDHRKTVKDLHRFIRNQGMTFDDFIVEAFQQTANEPIPDYIRAVETLDDTTGFAEESATHSPTLSPSQTSRSTISRTGTGYPQQLAARPHRNNQQFNLGQLDIQGTVWNSPKGRALYRINHSQSCHEPQREFEFYTLQLLPPHKTTKGSTLMSRVGKDDVLLWTLINGADPKGMSNTYHEFICKRCRQPSHTHFISIDHLEPSDEIQRNILNESSGSTFDLPVSTVSTKEGGTWLWMNRCFFACLCSTRGNEMQANSSLEQASEEFKRLLLEKKDPLLLTAAGIVITVLHQHNQDDIALRVMQSANAVVDTHLPEGDPIRITINYLTISANSEIGFNEPGCIITSTTLRDVYSVFCEQYQPEHPYAIAALHNLSWMLKYEGKYSEAEGYARRVGMRAKEVFGEKHMQYISSLAIRAACLDQMEGFRTESMGAYGKVIELAQEMLGKNHPYALEAKRRLAGVTEKVAGQEQHTLELLEQVLRGRVMMLGRRHSYTEGAKQDYEKKLKAFNRWTDANGEDSMEQQEMERLFSIDTPGDRITVQREKRSYDTDDNDDHDEEMTYDDDEDDDDEPEGTTSPRLSNAFAGY